MAKKDAKTDLGAVRIRNEVISAIVSVAVLEVKGVTKMKRGITAEVLRMLGKKSLERGVRVNLIDSGVKIGVSIVVEYGANIPAVAKLVQENVKKSVKEMTGLSLVEVNVNIQGISQAKPGLMESARVDEHKSVG